MRTLKALLAALLIAVPFSGAQAAALPASPPATESTPFVLVPQNQAEAILYSGPDYTGTPYLVKASTCHLDTTPFPGTSIKLSAMQSIQITDPSSGTEVLLGDDLNITYSGLVGNVHTYTSSVAVRSGILPASPKTLLLDGKACGDSTSAPLISYFTDVTQSTDPIKAGDVRSVSWKVRGAASVSISPAITCPGQPVALPFIGSECQTGALAAGKTTFTLTATAENGRKSVKALDISTDNGTAAACGQKVATTHIVCGYARDKASGKLLENTTLKVVGTNIASTTAYNPLYKAVISADVLPLISDPVLVEVGSSGYQSVEVSVSKAALAAGDIRRDVQLTPFVAETPPPLACGSWRAEFSFPRNAIPSWELTDAHPDDDLSQNSTVRFSAALTRGGIKIWSGTLTLSEKLETICDQLPATTKLGDVLTVTRQVVPSTGLLLGTSPSVGNLIVAATSITMNGNKESTSLVTVSMENSLVCINGKITVAPTRNGATLTFNAASEHASVPVQPNGTFYALLPPGNYSAYYEAAPGLGQAVKFPAVKKQASGACQGVALTTDLASNEIRIYVHQSNAYDPAQSPTVVSLIDPATSKEMYRKMVPSNQTGISSYPLDIPASFAKYIFKAVKYNYLPNPYQDPSFITHATPAGPDAYDYSFSLTKKNDPTLSFTLNGTSFKLTGDTSVGDYYAAPGTFQVIADTYTDLRTRLKSSKFPSCVVINDNDPVPITRTGAGETGGSAGAWVGYSDSPPCVHIAPGLISKYQLSDIVSTMNHEQGHVLDSIIRWNPNNGYYDLPALSLDQAKQLLSQFASSWKAAKALPADQSNAVFSISSDYGRVNDLEGFATIHDDLYGAEGCLKYAAAASALPQGKARTILVQWHDIINELYGGTLCPLH